MDPETRHPSGGAGADDAGREELLRRVRHLARNSLNSLQLNTHLLIQASVSRDDRVLLEQNLAAMKDIDQQLELMRLVGLATAPVSRPLDERHHGDLVEDVVRTARDVSRDIETVYAGPETPTVTAALDRERLLPAFRILLRHALGDDHDAAVRVRVGPAKSGALRFRIEGAGPRGRGRPPRLAELEDSDPCLEFPLDVVVAAALVATQGGELTVSDAGPGRAVCEVALPA